MYKPGDTVHGKNNFTFENNIEKQNKILRCINQITWKMRQQCILGKNFRICVDVLTLIYSSGNFINMPFFATTGPFCQVLSIIVYPTQGVKAWPT